MRHFSESGAAVKRCFAPQGLCVILLGIASCSCPSTLRTSDREPPPRQLPEGFVAVPGTGVHETGWPLEIKCSTDGAVMVFVPGGAFFSGLDNAQIRQVARLKLPFDPTKPDSLADAIAETKESLTALILSMKNDKDERARHDLMQLTVEQLLAISMLSELQARGTEIPEGELQRCQSEDRPLEGLLGNAFLREALSEEELAYLRNWKGVEDPVEKEVEALAGEFLPRSIKHIEPFYIDKYEVTNRQYRLFTDETKFNKHLPGIVNPGYDGDNLAPSGPRRVYYLWDDEKRNDDDQPVTCVSPEDAVLYAEWAGKSLPSRLQWVRAAVGDGNRIFPWGDDFQPHYVKCKLGGVRRHSARLNEDPGEKRSPGLTDLLKNLRNIGGVSVPAKVGSSVKDRSPFGCFDMTGNVSEWVHIVEKDRYQLIGGNADTSIFEWLVPTSKGGHVEPEVGGFRTVLLLRDAT